MQLVEPLIDAAVVDQFLVRSNLRDAAPIHHHDFVRPPDSGEPVRDHDHGAIAHQRLERLLHQNLRFRIQMRRGFVQNQDGRVLEQRPRDGQPLPLSSAQLDAALADHGVVAFVHPLDELFGQSVARGFANLFVLGFGPAVADVVRHRVIEQEGLLRDDADLRAQRGDLEIAHVLAVDPNGAPGDIVESRDQVGERGFSRRRSDPPAPPLHRRALPGERRAERIRWARSDSGSRRCPARPLAGICPASRRSVFRQSADRDPDTRTLSATRPEPAGRCCECR